MNLLNPTFDHVKQSPASCKSSIFTIPGSLIMKRQSPMPFSGSTRKGFLRSANKSEREHLASIKQLAPLKADCISLLTVWRPCSEPVMKGHLETVVLQKAAGYLAKFIVCQCHHSASTLMPAADENTSKAARRASSQYAIVMVPAVAGVFCLPISESVCPAIFIIRQLHGAGLQLGDARL